MTDTKIVFACDESGAKGYADQAESFPGEVGVFAGVLVPEECEGVARQEFQAILDKYAPKSGKLHIADLPEGQQEGLRRDVYAAIRKLNLPCFWYAIHVEGLRTWHEMQRKIIEEARMSASLHRPEPRVKQGSVRDKPPSMHEELFAGLYSHIIAFLEERSRKKVSVEIRTDQIDSPIVKNFESVAKRLLSDDPYLTTVKGWDTITKKVVEGRVEVGVNIPPSLKLEVVVTELAINVVREGDGYVLAADVLANSLNYLFKNRSSSELYKPLNHPDAVIEHPIAENLAAFCDWGSGDPIGDKLYSHPKAQESCL
ncbi:hypothetical protein K1W69_00135 [Hoeflea sp. WL0058]|uniref:DUF3800 domain-containing protein n=1 Tax=Flavimaribacter sediminis TaxID=2865987 RepID=A0AAE2ZIY2_9HYPH|nr:hypothetical protein [Flavimaribacter sediminis]MBW8635577.1 hypothetical protein [Flavimaribacter sediminis]